MKMSRIEFRTIISALNSLFMKKAKSTVSGKKNKCQQTFIKTLDLTGTFAQLFTNQKYNTHVLR